MTWSPCAVVFLRGFFLRQSQPDRKHSGSVMTSCSQHNLAIWLYKVKWDYRPYFLPSLWKGTWFLLHSHNTLTTKMTRIHIFQEDCSWAPLPTFALSQLLIEKSLQKAQYQYLGEVVCTTHTPNGLPLTWMEFQTRMSVPQLRQRAKSHYYRLHQELHFCMMLGHKSLKAWPITAAWFHSALHIHLAPMRHADRVPFSAH